MLIIVHGFCSCNSADVFILFFFSTVFSIYSDESSLKVSMSQPADSMNNQVSKNSPMLTSTAAPVFYGPNAMLFPGTMPVSGGFMMPPSFAPPNSTSSQNSATLSATNPPSTSSTSSNAASGNNSNAGGRRGGRQNHDHTHSNRQPSHHGQSHSSQPNEHGNSRNQANPSHSQQGKNRRGNKGGRHGGHSGSSGSGNQNDRNRTPCLRKFSLLDVLFLVLIQFFLYLLPPPLFSFFVFNKGLRLLFLLVELMI